MAAMDASEIVDACQITVYRNSENHSVYLSRPQRVIRHQLQLVTASAFLCVTSHTLYNYLALSDDKILYSVIVLILFCSSIM
jgi:hypothetical protein